MRVPGGSRVLARPWLAMTLMASAVVCGSPAVAQTTGFTLIGHIESFALTNPGDPLSAASMTVRGITVTLPRNLLVTMPGRYLSATDLFRGPTLGPAVQRQSGLALRDTRTPVDQARFVPFEAEIIGNQDASRYIAGAVRISQGALHSGAGTIQAINQQTGEMRIGVPGGPTSARVRLNDPEGIFGPRSTGLDARFALDAENAPVHARTGFPVCVQTAQNGQNCPSVNRPAGNPTRFTCGAAAASADAAAIPSCDPRRPVPLREGDYVTYVGMIVADPPTVPAAQRGYFVAAHGLDAELGIYTSPGENPAYVFVEEAIQGTKGEPFPGIPQEETTRFRIVGFTTDPSRNVEVWLVDSDRARPAAPLPVIPPAPPFPGTSFTGPGGLTPSNGAQLGRFRNTWPAKDDARPVRRDVLVRIVGGYARNGWGTTARGLNFGTYLAPVGEYIYPEATQFGTPGRPPPVPFENFCFLSLGGGSYTDARGTTHALGPLTPFPDSGRGSQSQLVGNGPNRACTGQ